jgi:hypothetical protein
VAGLRGALRPLREQDYSADRQSGGERRGQLPLSGRVDPTFPKPEEFRLMIAEAGFEQTRAEPILGGLVCIHSGWKI